MSWATSSRTLGTAALFIVAALTGCGSAPANQTLAPATPIPLASSWRAGLFVDGYGPQGLGPSQTSQDPTSTVTDATQRALADVGFRTADFGTGYSVKLLPQGDTLTQSSLHFCGAEYPSEKNRVARRLVALYDSTGSRVGLTSDAIKYDTAAHAAAALAEIRTELSSCMANTVIKTGTTELVVNPQPTTSVLLTNLLPEAERVVMNELVAEPSTGSSGLIQTLWQQHGPYVVALTFEVDPKTPFTAEDQRLFNKLGGSIANRLTANVAG